MANGTLAPPHPFPPSLFARSKDGDAERTRKRGGGRRESPESSWVGDEAAATSAAERPSPAVKMAESVLEVVGKLQSRLSGSSEPKKVIEDSPSWKRRVCV